MSGKVVAIVGGTGGIGLATTARFAAGGDRIAVIGREPDRTDEATRVLSHWMDKEHFIAVSGDATDRTTVEQFVLGTVERFGRLDVLVHVAGLSGRRWGDGPLDSCTEEGWQGVINNNLYSVYLSNQYALRVMLDQKSGVIINVASVLGMIGTPAHFTTHAYTASKGAIISMTKSAAVYYAKDNIRMNVVCPGLLDTPMSQRAMGDPVIREALEYFQPLSPHVGYPQDVAGAIYFLTGDDARFVTGIALPIDGGWTAQ